MLSTASAYRTWAGLLPADLPSDAEIEKALLRYETLVESYIERNLAEDRHFERYYHIDSDPIILANYPVSDVLGIAADGSVLDVNEMLLHGQKGELFHYGKLLSRKIVNIEYVGGFREMPDDLEIVIFTLAQNFLDAGGKATIAAGAVKKETVFGVSAIEYFGESSSSGSDSKINVYPELGDYALILDKYRANPMVA